MTTPITDRGRKASFVLGTLGLVALGATMVLGLSLPGTREQSDYSRLIAIHPPIAWCAYLAVGVCALASVLYLIPRTRSRRWDRIAVSSAEVGVVFIGLTLATGSIWGRPTWGVWWTWDARLTVTALMFATFLGYLAVRRAIAGVDARARVSAVVAVLGSLSVPINHMAVEWWRTLHQGRSLAQADPSSTLDGAFIATMLLGMVAMTLVYAWLVIQRYALEVLEEDAGTEGLEVAIAARRAEGQLV